MSSREQLYFHNQAVSFVGPVYGETLNGLDAAGSPVIIPASPEDNGMQRSDMKQTEGVPEDPRRMFHDIFNEGSLLAGVDAIDIGNNQEVIVFNSAAASPHSVLRVKYDQFSRTFRNEAAKLGFTIQDGPLVKGKDSTADEIKTPTYVPLDMLVWVMVRNKDTGVISPTDLSDFCSPHVNNHLIDQYRFQLGDAKLEEIFSSITRRGKLATNTLLDLYENVIRQNVLKPHPKVESDLPPKTDEDILQGVVNGYYRRDKAKLFDQFNYDHRGKGPMSNPSVHFRYTCHIPVEVINKLAKENPRMSYEAFVEQLKQSTEYFAKDMPFAQMKRRPGERKTDQEVLHDYFQNFNAMDIVKMVDPYASIIHDEMIGWLQNLLQEKFAKFNATVDQFKHHTTEFEKELRVSEGAVIKIPIENGSEETKQRILSQSLAIITRLMGEVLYPLWDDVNEFVVTKINMTRDERNGFLSDLQSKYNLSESAIKKIQALQPTERQLKNYQKELDLNEATHQKIERKLNKYQENKKLTRQMKQILKNKINHFQGTFDDFVELVNWEQYGQLFEDEDLNQGYNIPGVPGLGITHHYDENGHLNIQLGWLMSMKGLSEQWNGAMYKNRVERNTA